MHQSTFPDAEKKEIKSNQTNLNSGLLWTYIQYSAFWLETVFIH